MKNRTLLAIVASAGVAVAGTPVVLATAASGPAPAVGTETTGAAPAALDFGAASGARVVADAAQPFGRVNGTGQARLLSDSGSSKTYFSSDSKQVCLVLQEPEASTYGCAPIASATDPETPLTVSLDYGDHVSTAGLVPDGTTTISAIDAAGKRLEAPVVNNSFTVISPERLAEVSANSSQGATTAKLAHSAQSR